MPLPAGRSAGRIGGRTPGFFLATITLAVIIGPTASDVMRPGTERV